MDKDEFVVSINGVACVPYEEEEDEISEIHVFPVGEDHYYVKSDDGMLDGYVKKDEWDNCRKG